MAEAYKSAAATVLQAIEVDNTGKYEEARVLYNRAIDQYIEALRLEKNPSIKEAVQKRVVGYMDRAEMLKTYKPKGSQQDTALPRVEAHKPKPKLIQIMIALNPDPKTGKWVWRDPVYGGSVYGDYTGDTFDECVPKIFAAVDKARVNHPSATLQECEILSKWPETYEKQIAEVKVLLMSRFPGAEVTASDDVGYGRAFD